MPKNAGQLAQQAPAEGSPHDPGRWVLEFAHAHLGCVFHGVRTRQRRLAASFEAFLATVATHRIIDQARL